MENQTITEVQNKSVLQPNKKEWVKPTMIEIQVNFGEGSNIDGDFGAQNS